MSNHTSPSYSEVLTSQEIRQVTTDLLSSNPEMRDSDIASVLEELAFLAESAILFQGIVSGDLKVVGYDDGTIKVIVSERRKRLLM